MFSPEIYQFTLWLVRFQLRIESILEQSEQIRISCKCRRNSCIFLVSSESTVESFACRCQVSEPPKPSNSDSQKPRDRARLWANGRFWVDNFEQLAHKKCVFGDCERVCKIFSESQLKWQVYRTPDSGDFRFKFCSGSVKLVENTMSQVFQKNFDALHNMRNKNFSLRFGKARQQIFECVYCKWPVAVKNNDKKTVYINKSN